MSEILGVEAVNAEEGGGLGAVAAEGGFRGDRTDLYDG